jgi:Na+/melibiose symporter-like transporter
MKTITLKIVTIKIADRGDNYWLCRQFGRRKSWHLFGTICVLFTFPFIFLRCVGCQDSDQYAQLIYYASFVVIFQFGWACIQISHLAMIPELVSSSIYQYAIDLF